MKVRVYVHVRSKDGGKTALLRPGDVVPDWAEVSNPDALDSSPEPVDEPPVPEAPAPEPVAEVPASPVPTPKPPARRKAAPKAPVPPAE